MHRSSVRPRPAPPASRPATVAPSVAACAAVLALLATPALARAQHAELGVFGAWYPSLDASGSGGNLPLWGLSVGGGGTGAGLRASGAVRTTAGTADGTTAPAGTTPTWGSAGWVADVDMVYDTRNNPLLQPLTTALLGFAPSFFAGAGGMGRRDADGSMRAVPVLSWGAGVSRSIAGSLALTTEARRRSVSRGTGGELPDGIRSGWEYRAGLSLRFGGSRRGSGGGSLPRLPIPLPGGGSGTMGSASGAAVVDTGEDYLGVRYVYGGTTPRGFDCSGFVQYVFNRHGVKLPRTSRQQAQVGRTLATSVAALRPGDLLFFNTEGSRIDHVAMYAGDNRIIHSSSSGGGVRYDDLDSSRGRWFVSKMVSARRVTDGRGNSLVDGATLTRLLGEVVRTFDQPDRAPRP